MKTIDQDQESEKAVARQGAAVLARQRFLRALAWIWIAAAIGYCLWEATAYRGLFALLSEGELVSFGGYAPLLNCIALSVLLSLPAGILLRYLANEKSDAEPPLYAAQRSAQRIASLLTVIGASLLLACATTAVYAAYAFPQATRSAQMIAVGIDDAGIEPSEGSTRLVAGRMGRVAVFRQFWFIGDAATAFAPYTPVEADGRNARYFVEIDFEQIDDLRGKLNRPVWSGLLVEGGLPGTMRALYEKFGIAVPPHHYTLYSSRAKAQSIYWIKAGQLGLSAIILLLLGWAQQRRANRLAPRIDEPVEDPYMDVADILTAPLPPKPPKSGFKIR